MKKPAVPLPADDPFNDLVSTVAMVLNNMRTSENSRLTRHDIGYKVSGFYNHQFHLRIDLVRLDKKPFFSDTVP